MTSFHNKFFHSFLDEKGEESCYTV